jgi:hypothetical protein
VFIYEEPRDPVPPRHGEAERWEDDRDPYAPVPVSEREINYECGVCGYVYEQRVDASTYHPPGDLYGPCPGCQQTEAVPR